LSFASGSPAGADLRCLGIVDAFRRAVPSVRCAEESFNLERVDLPISTKVNESLYDRGWPARGPAPGHHALEIWIVVIQGNIANVAGA
jgi:hypothetical protein